MFSKSSRVAASSSSRINPLIALPSMDSGVVENEGSERRSEVPVAVAVPMTASAKDGKSVTGRSTGTAATSQAPSMLSSSTGTSLTDLVDLDRKYKSRFVAGWVHTPISLRLLLMLVVPFISLIILLVILISGEVSDTSNASKITVLANYAQDSLLLVAELSAEYTDSLWWILNRDLKLGITWNTGGVNGFGMSNQTARTDLKINDLLQFASGNSMYSVNSYLAADLAVLQYQVGLIYDVRYNVQHFRYTEDQITKFYLPLLDGLLNMADRTAALADTATQEDAQALVSWSRTKTAYERERHTVGMILLQKNFTLTHFTDWSNILAVQSVWQARFEAIAPNHMLDIAMSFFEGDLVRTVQEMRYQGLATFLPGNESCVPPLSFDYWMGNCSLLIGFMRDFRANLTQEIIDIANSNKSSSATTLGLYILLACLAAGISILVGLLVGWSIDVPWRSMLRMKDRMYVRLTDENKRYAIVSQFVPGEFLAMMGLRNLFELQLGSCILKRASVVCVEIRNFARLSERMAPQQTFQFLSLWLQECGPIIRRHGGFVERFRGNGLTAIFHDPNDSLDAGLELLEAVENRNKESANASLQIDTGIAIHTGDLMLGTIGDQVRIDTAIISEALTTTLQVARLSVRYQASLLVTREAFMILNIEGITARFLGESGVQGLHIHPQVYEVLRPADEPKLDSLNEFSQAMQLHQEGNFSAAADLYRSVLQIDPSDAVARIRLQLAERREWVDIFS
eukprot:RCo001854